ncbi:hypothetical protein R1sor_000846 [Riccia sorocarpa]|uniref:Secreted protein n=1 Tax=Riccia sorocarpa TaxID=122646 RepID=A0ABD3GYA4_9MARC
MPLPLPLPPLLLPVLPVLLPVLPVLPAAPHRRKSYQPPVLSSVELCEQIGDHPPRLQSLCLDLLRVHLLEAVLADVMGVVSMVSSPFFPLNSTSSSQIDYSASNFPSGPKIDCSARIRDLKFY